LPWVRCGVCFAADFFNFSAASADPSPEMVRFYVACRQILVAGFAVAALAGLQGCAGMSRRVDLRTDPPGAEVTDRAGGVLGTTPLTLEKEALAKVTDHDRLYVRIRKPGYEPRTLILDVDGADQHDIALSKLEEKYFTQTTLNDFTPEINGMTRELLQIQGLLVVRNNAQAERELEAFLKKYPHVAPALVMMANVELARGEREKARGYLTQASSIDPADPVVQRMLKALSGPKPASVGGKP
jgi:hypothetical protein